jgi:hemerythrin-like metal-binding protein
MGSNHGHMNPGRGFDANRVGDIDRQHALIYRLLREFSAALHEGSDREAVLLILEEIIDRSQGHFAAEESMLRDAEHPSYRFQKATHRLIVDELTLLQRHLHASARFPHEACIHAMDLLLVHHIRDEPAYFAPETPAVVKFQVAMA